MFVRFRQTKRRLQCSLIETRRVTGKVRHEHIASLGSIEVPPSIADRFAFWAALYPRLDKISNRFSHETKGRLIGQVHARIPMPTADEERQLQKENAEADERFWSGHRDYCADIAAGHRELIATTERAAAQNEAAAEAAGAKATAAKDRLANLERGESVAGGLGKPMTYRDFERILLDAGLTKRDIRHAEWLHTVFTKLEKFPGAVEDFWASFHARREAGEHRIERQAVNDALRKRGLAWVES